MPSLDALFGNNAEHPQMEDTWSSNDQSTRLPSKMNQYCNKEISPALSSDEYNDLLKNCIVISCPTNDDDNSSPPSAVDSAADKIQPPNIDSTGIRDRDVIVVPNLASLDKLSLECVDNNRIFVAANRESTLHESKSITIDHTNVHRHYYCIENNDCLKLVSIYITVVFAGVFVGPDYRAGKIDVSLKRLSGEPFSDVQMGTKTLQSQNSIDSIGIITIDHELESNVIESGLIELTITAEAESRYSIRIFSGSSARRVDLEVKRQTAELQDRQRRIAMCKSKHKSLFYLKQLLERKIIVADDLKEHDRVSIHKCKEKLERLEDELDHSNGKEDEDTLLLRKIDALSIEHKHFLSRNLQKGAVRKDISSKLDDVKHEIVNIVKDEERLVKESGEVKAILSAAYVRLGLGLLEV